MPERAVVCWELLGAESPAVEQARRLYEETQAPAERIPWRWIEGAVADRAQWRPGRWSAHLLGAALQNAAGSVGTLAGFTYGIHVPDYGGYATYLGVAPRHRRHGIGTRLLRLLTRVLQVDAECEGADLPFVMWESHRPEAAAPAEEWDLWRARLRLFARAGAWWVGGLTFYAPNFARRGGPPVPLQLFLIPVDRATESFDASKLREVAAGLLREVYRREEGDVLFDRTLPPDCRPELRPVAEVGERGA